MNIWQDAISMDLGYLFKYVHNVQPKLPDANYLEE